MVEETASSQTATQPEAHRGSSFDLDRLSNRVVSAEECLRLQTVLYSNWRNCSNFHKIIIRLILWGRGTLRRAIAATLIILIFLAGVIIAANQIPPGAATALFIIAGIVVLGIALLVFIWPRPPKE
jgi:hypothetical protein